MELINALLLVLILGVMGNIPNVMSSPLDFGPQTTTLFPDTVPTSAPVSPFDAGVAGAITPPFVMPAEIPSRASVRCRWSRVLKTNQIQYSVFMAPVEEELYPDWCKGFRELLRQHAENDKGDHLEREDVEWLRCDMDTRDKLSHIHGRQATFMLKDSFNQKSDYNTYNQRSVARTMAESMPGAVLDWLDWEGCYENNMVNLDA